MSRAGGAGCCGPSSTSACASAAAPLGLRGCFCCWPALGPPPLPPSRLGLLSCLSLSSAAMPSSRRLRHYTLARPARWSFASLRRALLPHHPEVRAALDPDAVLAAV